jgi:hypothetical protein
MRELASEVSVELLEVIASALGTIVFTLGGFLVEQDGLQHYVLGQTTVGAWEIGMGLLFLVIGTYLLGYQEFWPRLRALRQA